MMNRVGRLAWSTNFKPNTAIYACTASRSQLELGYPDSIASQLCVCLDFAVVHDLNVVSTYYDEGSGNRELGLRPGLRALLKDAQDHRFDVVLGGDLSRLSCDMNALVVLLDRLQRHGIRILTISGSEVEWPVTLFKYGTSCTPESVNSLKSEEVR